eukprot:TRINITY_DN10175_c0_g1_i1.p2 TRINITY_DN10175_c0_g1~~TRINITY_DN10175_c0_g1_i1.p2  ORF type:complete len:290 (+),score=67.75 TRINITY_DN10175_c0_g1_i1:85-954(+)
MGCCCCCHRVCPFGDGPDVLYTIPFSHFCEAARWAMQANNSFFVERRYLPGLHAMASPIPRLRRGCCGCGGSEVYSRGPAGSTPLLVAANGRILANDSWAILEMHAGPVPERTKELLDKIVGPVARLWVYSYLLRDDYDEHWCKFVSTGCEAVVPAWQRCLFSLRGFRRTVAGKMWAFMVRSDAHVAEQTRRLREVLPELEALLPSLDAAPGTPLSAPAIALAALFAPLVCPPEYDLAWAGNPVFPYEELPGDLRQGVAGWRATAVGQWVLRTYAARRMQANQHAHGQY